MKAIRSLEQHVHSLQLPKLKELSDDEVHQKLSDIDDERIFVVAEALRRGITPEEINAITKIDIWFIDRIQIIVDMETQAAPKVCPTAPPCGWPRNWALPTPIIAELVGITQPRSSRSCGRNTTSIPSFKMVDTCAAEFDAETPYYYSTYDGENEAIMDGQRQEEGAGPGFRPHPHRPGHRVRLLLRPLRVGAASGMGYETIIINNNPETVSTDFDIADKLYFEPLTAEDVENIVELEKPWGAVVQFGGQTAIKLAKALTEMGVPDPGHLR